MIRRLLSNIGVSALVTAVLLFLSPLSQAQRSGGHSGGGHSGGGHGGGAHAGGHGGYHGGGDHHGGYDGGYYHHHHFYGGYPYGYGYFWGGYYPGYYYDQGYYDYYQPQIYGYYPQYAGDYQSLYDPPASSEAAEFGSWDRANERVMARVIVPATDAQLWIEGEKTSSDGDMRTFVSPPLEAGKYSYTFQARWSQDGKTTEQTRKVSVHPGDRITVDFTTAESK
jgi:uncharacterized protein (TIGR03000 family)